MRRQCAWAIGNIANESYDMRNYLIEMDVMKHLVGLMKTDDKFPVKGNGKYAVMLSLIVIVAVWAISNLFRGKRPPDWDSVDTAIPLLCQLILNHRLDEEVLSDAW